MSTQNYCITQSEFQIVLNPFELFYFIYQNYYKNIYLFESSFYHEEIGRYSIIGFDKIQSFECKDNQSIETYESQLKIVLNQYHIDYKGNLPIGSGLLGYFSYDAYSLNPKLKKLSNLDDLINMPKAYFCLFRHLVIFDHLTKKQFLITLHQQNESANDFQHVDFIKIFNQINIQILQTDIQILKSKKSLQPIDIQSNFTKHDYLKAIEKTKQYIFDGHIYVMNLTQQLRCQTDQSALSIYAKLREINPSPFGGLLIHDNFQIISSSPERFLKIQDQEIETRPIKGTVKRYPIDLKQDFISKQELINSHKDKSELLMIVDLERNDFNQFCEFHSVKVEELYRLETYATVHHLVSIIKGKIKNNYNIFDCFKSCFVGGSITGAPKQRAIEIIHELEKISRSAYTGCMGYFSFHNTCDFNILIRTIILKDQVAYFGVGGGITWESDALSEFEETLLKAKALIQSLE